MILHEPVLPVETIEQLAPEGRALMILHTAEMLGVLDMPLRRALTYTQGVVFGR